MAGQSEWLIRTGKKADQYTVHQQLHRTVIGAVICIVVVILFPFRWRGEEPA
jgi:hypothetical protein